MAIYQFMIAVRTGGQNNPSAMLTNDDGDPTSHVQGMFNRTIRFLSEGVRPVFVFDGKPPTFKSGELLKRREKREKAQAALKTAEEEGNIEEQGKQSKRLVRAGHKENQDCQKLLRLMGVPVILAPCEAEAQAAALAKSGLVYATGTEDMDALTFATPVLLRKMTFANASKATVQQMNYAKAIEGLELTHEQFVDLCILMGCDYTDTIRGIGPKTALKLVREHKTIEAILKHLEGNKKYVIPEAWIPDQKKNNNSQDGDGSSAYEEEGEKVKPKEADAVDAEEEDDDEKAAKAEKAAIDAIPAYVHARRLFMEHEVMDKATAEEELKWKACQPVELTKYLVEDMGFDPARVSTNIEKLQKAFKSNSKPQSRMDSFFKAVPQDPAKVAAKRKAMKDKNKAAAASAKKSKTGPAGKKKR